MGEIDPIKFQHDIEQFESAMVSFARVAGSYYAELIRNGVPEELADSLVVELARRLFDQRRTDE